MSTIHERTIELLPWYVNGTLQVDEQLAVEHHLAECLPCRAALRQEQQLGARVREHSEVPPGTEQGISNLLRRIDNDKPRSGLTRLRPQIVWSAGLIAALALAAFVLPALLRPGDPIDSASFSTLTDATTEADFRLDIVFADGLPESAKEAVIRAVGGRIIGGPTALGRYTIAIDATGEMDVDGLIEDLRENPGIRFVGRNFIDPSRSEPEGP